MPGSSTPGATRSNPGRSTTPARPTSRNNITVRLWVRNVLDDDNVTGKYVTSDTSGFFRNYFVTEPRLFGLSFRMDYGD